MHSSLAITLLALLHTPTITTATTTTSDTSASKTPQFHNSARHTAADPHVIYDANSGKYYAYSTDGADKNHLFAIYTSPDLSTWSKHSGGVLNACYDDAMNKLPNGQACWARDWQWAPETYYNDKTGWYFFFFAGRLRQDMTKDYFRYSAFEEPSKIGVAVSKSPTGPFHEIESKPIDWFPFDPAYHDVNLIMDAKQMLPPQSLEKGQKAPKGTYIPTIDPNVFFDNDGRIYLYASRNAYRNWNWDAKLGKYIEESNIIAVELDRAWWDDPHATTMPQIVASQMDINARNAPKPPCNPARYNGTGEVGHPLRKDGWKTIISYGADPQAWENFHVNDYQKYNGTKKDRRWSEGSTLITRPGANGKPTYFITYSANNFEASNYGVGFAQSSSPLGPFRKSSHNPIISQQPNASIPIFSTGHGSIVASPPKDHGVYVGAQDVTRQTPPGAELFYVHHGRNSTDSGRSLYTTRIKLDATAGDAAMSAALTSNDQPLPKWTYPIEVEAVCNEDDTTVAVYARQGSVFDISEATNRVVGLPGDVPVSELEHAVNGSFIVSFGKHVDGIAYQRLKVDGSWDTVGQAKISC